MKKREVAWKESPYLYIGFNMEVGKNNNNSTTAVHYLHNNNKDT